MAPIVMRSEPADFPILDPAFKARSPSLCRALAGGEPLVSVRLPFGGAGWLVVDHAPARALLCDPRLVKQPAPDDASTVPGEGPHPLFSHMLSLDPPTHTRLRAVLSAAMPAERLRALRPLVTRVADALASELAARHGQTVDLIPAFALALPIRVIARLLGMPATDEARIQAWSAALLKADLVGPHHTWAIADEIDGVLRALAAQKRRWPDNGLMSAFVRAEDGGLITASEVSAMTFLLLTAGHETSMNLIANGIFRLLQTPETWRHVGADATLAQAATEEVLRVESPIEFATPRHIAADYDVAGQTLRRGQMVFVSLGAANRDPAVFRDADLFDVQRRSTGRHLAFGRGVHACPGAPLARLEGEVALAVLAGRLPKLRLAVAPEGLRWVPGLVMRGLAALPVRIPSRC